jgi:hypothetical protein
MLPARGTFSIPLPWAALVAVASCGRPSAVQAPRSAPERALTPNDGKSSDGGVDEKSKLESFDCHSAWEHKEGESLRAFASGGPYGATWNWYREALRCEVVVRAACDGEARLVLRAGKARQEQTSTLEAGSVQRLAAAIPGEVWEGELEGSATLPYETLLLTAHVELVCGTAEEGRWVEHLVDAFVGGFAGGE